MSGSLTGSTQTGSGAREVDPVHLAFARRIHHTQLRLYALGGIATLGLALITPALWGAASALTSVQYVLVGSGSLLVGLALVRAALRGPARRSRQSTVDYCSQEDIPLASLLEAARKRGELYFFVALWDGHEVDNPQ